MNARVVRGVGIAAVAVVVVAALAVLGPVLVLYALDLVGRWAR